MKNSAGLKPSLLFISIFSIIFFAVFFMGDFFKYLSPVRSDLHYGRHYKERVDVFRLAVEKVEKYCQRLGGATEQPRAGEILKGTGFSMVEYRRIDAGGDTCVFLARFGVWDGWREYAFPDSYSYSLKEIEKSIVYFSVAPESLNGYLDFNFKTKKHSYPEGVILDDDVPLAERESKDISMPCVYRRINANWFVETCPIVVRGFY